MKYEPVIGLEIHAELQTQTKMFCGCDADHTSISLSQNTLICPYVQAARGNARP